MLPKTILKVLLFTIILFFITFLLLIASLDFKSSLNFDNGINFLEDDLLQTFSHSAIQIRTNKNSNYDYALYREPVDNMAAINMVKEPLETADNNYFEYVDNKYLWGTYKPHLFHCITQALPKRLSFGIIYQDDLKLYHSYRDIKRFGKFTEYIYHDGEEFAQSILHDDKNGFSIDNYFYKELANSDRQKWHSITKNKNQHSRLSFLGSSSIVSLVYYFTLEDLAEQVNEDTRYLHFDFSKGIISVKDTSKPFSKSLESFKVIVYTNDTKESVPLSSLEGIYCYVSSVAKHSTWKVKSELEKEMKMDSTYNIKVLPNNHESQDSKTTLIAIQFLTIQTSRFTFHITYSNIEEENFLPVSNNYGFVESVTRYSEILFAPKYSKRFPSKVKNGQHRQCAMSSLSNLLSGIGYYYGSILVKYDQSRQPDLSLFTATPSKTEFPRGFLWDEGFHGLIYCKWNPEICLRALNTWINTELDSGWIPREQARGSEPINYANAEYISQIRDEANPPTLLFHLLRLIQYKEEGKLPAKAEEKLKELYPKLEKWLEWFNSTQKIEKDGNILFQWKSQRENQGLVLGSGLDDYPRGVIPRQTKPLAHLDLQVWMIFFTENLVKVAEFSGKDENTQKLKEFNQNLRKSLAEFLDPQEHVFKDLVLDMSNNQKTFSPHFGYVNLFPLFFGYIEKDSLELVTLLKYIQDSYKLWTSYGLRSLAYDDPLYMKTRDKYWGGPIWININYLTLRGLKLYYYDNDEVREIYDELRDNIIETICTNKEKTGYFYEQYNQDNGKGQKNHPFSGWTALVGLIIDEQY